MAKKPLVSFIIVNYNGRRWLNDCLNSVLKIDYPRLEVILVDNASTDGSVEYIRRKFGGDERLRIIVNDRNYGFGRANNIGARHARGAYLVFLNNDTRTDPSWLNEVVLAMEEDKTIGACQPKIRVLEKPEVISNYGSFLTNPGFLLGGGWGERDHGQYDYVREVFYASGAALVIRREVFDKIGGFDEHYFLYWEDVDLCWRVWLNGYRVLFIPTRDVVYHSQYVAMSGDASASMKRRRQVYYAERYATYFMLKNFGAAGVSMLFRRWVLRLVMIVARCVLHRDPLLLSGFLKALLRSLLDARKALREHVVTIRPLMEARRREVNGVLRRVVLDYGMLQTLRMVLQTLRVISASSGAGRLPGGRAKRRVFHPGPRG